jgi:hypothetical protein
MDSRDCKTQEVNDDQGDTQYGPWISRYRLLQAWENISRDWKAVLFGISLLLLVIIGVSIPW